MSELDHARDALERVCARGDLQRARELAEDFVDHIPHESPSIRTSAATPLEASAKRIGSDHDLCRCGGESRRSA
jgi:hypothetical protein